MSTNGLETSMKPASPRGRHQITRSITELSSPTKLHRQPHHAHRTHRRERTRDDAPHSAHPATSERSSFDMARRERVTPALSPDSSRRASVLQFGNDAIPGLLAPPNLSARKVATDEKVQEEKGKAASRVTGLKKSLIDLSDFSTTTTRRLDDTYYAVLEKTSTLQSTIFALKELAALSKDTTTSFETEAQEMVQQIGNQLESFGQFEEQEKSLDSLKERIQAGRAKVNQLSERVDVVRARIEGWERADAEWQERTRKRLKVIWIIMSVVFGVMILLFVGAQYASPAADIVGLDAVNVSLPTLSKDTVRSIASRSRLDEAMSESPMPSLWAEKAGNDDDRLRFFDEL